MMRKVFEAGFLLAIPLTIVIVFHVRFLLWMLLAPDQGFIFLGAMYVGMSRIGPALTSDGWGMLAWGLAVGLCASALYVFLLVLLHKSFPRVSRIVNLLLMVPLAGFCVHYSVTKEFSGSAPRLADDPAVNALVYSVFAALVGLVLWVRRMRKLDFWQWRALSI